MRFRKNALFVGPVAAFICFAACFHLQGCGSSDSEFSNGGDPNGGGNDGGTGSGGGFGDGAGGGGSGGSWTGAPCATASADSFRTPIYMQMVLDGSGSMDGVIVQNGQSVYGSTTRDTDDLNPQRPTIPNGGNSTEQAGQGPRGATGKKWLAARRALYSFWDKLTPASGGTADRSFGVGFHVFNSTTATSDGQVDVGIGAVTATQSSRLKARIAPNLSRNGAPGYPIGDVYGSGATPLVSAINGQGAIVRGFTADGSTLATGGKRVLVVITDGVPTDSQGNPSDAEKERAITSVTSLKQQSVITFVIGVGDPSAPTNEYDEAFLGRLAQAGGAAPNGCDPNSNCHFQITPGDKTTDQLRDEFIAAIDKIRDTVQSCDFDLVHPNGAPNIDPAKVNVVYTAGNGAETNLKKDPQNGWIYDNDSNPKKVLLKGSSCSTLKSDPGGKIRIVVGCATDVKVN
ncbi:VWA domain-containing protein [Pendulispora brunnea]|uniref:VWA domain-containing protein n=1 Tax=Pendulispora brunnea TaxID=2905690 RepID=A0ABZ2KPC1_9BACT